MSLTRCTYPAMTPRWPLMYGPPTRGGTTFRIGVPGSIRAACAGSRPEPTELLPPASAATSGPHTPGFLVRRPARRRRSRDSHIRHVRSTDSAVEIDDTHRSTRRSWISLHCVGAGGGPAASEPPRGPHSVGQVTGRPVAECGG